MRILTPSLVTITLMTAPVLAQETQEERDVGWIQGLIEDNLSGAGRAVIIEGFEGALSSRATIASMTIADDEGIWLRAEGLVFDWSRSALLSGAIEVSEMSAEVIELVRAPLSDADVPEPEATPFSFALPELPVGINIDQIQAGQIILGETLLGQELAFSVDGAVALSGGEGTASIRADRLDGAQGRFAISGSYSNESRILGLSIDLTEAEGGITADLLDLPGNPSVQLVLDGTAPIDDYTADLAIATAGVDRITGAFGFANTDAGQDLRLDISGDINALIETDFADFFGDQTDLRLRGGRDTQGTLRLSDLSIDAEAVRLEGFAEIDPDGWPVELSLSGAIAARDGSPVLLPFGEGQTFIRDALIDLSFDAAEGDLWTLTTTASEVVQPGLSLPHLSLTGRGVIQQGDDDTPARVNGDFAYAARDITLDDAGLAQAIGGTIAGDIGFEVIEDQPFEITDFTLTGPGIEAAANATIDTSDGLVITTKIATQAAEISRFSLLAGQSLEGAADLTLEGALRPLDGIFDITLAGTTTDLALGVDALDPHLAGDGELALRASRDTDGTRIDGLRITTPEITATAQADITSIGSDATFDIRLREVGLSLPDLAGPASLIGTATIGENGAGAVNTTFDLPNANFEIDAVAAAPDEGGLITFEMDADVADLAPYAPLVGQSIAGRAALAISGSAARDGGRADLFLTGDIEDIAIGIAQFDTLFAGRGTLRTRALRVNENAFRLEGLSLETPQLSLDADATVTNGAVQSNFDLALVDIADLEPRLAGPLTVDGRIARSAQGFVTTDVDMTGPGGTDATVMAQIDTGLADMPTSGSLVADIGDLSAFSRLAGQALEGAITAEIDGNIESLADALNSPFDALYAVTARDVAGLGRQLNGRVAAQGVAGRDMDGELMIDTRVEAPGDADITLAARLTPEGVVTTDLSADIGDIAAYSDLAQLRLAGALRTRITGMAQTDLSLFDLDFDLAGENLDVDGTALTGGIDLTGTARRDASGETDLRLSGTAPGNTTLSLAAQGLETVQTSLEISTGNIGAYAGLVGQPLAGAVSATISGPVTLASGSFDLAIAGQTTNLDPGIEAATSLLRGTGTLAGQVRRTADGGLTAQGVSVRYPNFNVTGDLSQDSSGGFGQFDLGLTDLGLFVPDFPGPATARGTAQILPQGGFRLEIAATGPGAIAADVAGDIAADGTLDLAINGTAPLGLANSFIEPNTLSGLSRFDMRVAGPPEIGSLTGTLRLEDGRFAAPSVRQALDNIEGSVVLTGQSAQLNIGGNLSDGGRITVSGPVALSNGFEAGLQIAGEGLILRDPTLYETSVDALVSVTGPLVGGAVIGGDINLGPTEIQVPSSTASTLGALPQVTHVGAGGQVRQTLGRAGLSVGGVEVATGDGGSGGAVYNLDLRINAPARVFIRGRGLDAELGGQLEITGTTDQVIPIGEFQLIRGRIDILEQRFDLTEGGAFLQGDFDPFIRLVATTEARDGTEVSIIVEGPATEPEVTFESSPELPQDEILSRLIFGRDLSDISPLQAIQLAAAVSTLAGSSSGGLLSDFRQNLGLDDLDITTDDDGNAAVRAGAYLSENVYTDVTVGSENTEINLNLDLTDDITVTGSTGTDGGTSIGIFFERDY